MLATQVGAIVKSQRHTLDMKQADLARRAGVSRTVLSRLERGGASPVQTDVLDRIFDALDIRPRISTSTDIDERHHARLEQQVRLERQRSRHLRIAIELATQPPGQAAGLIAKARAAVELWRSKGTCSPRYIERWSDLLALPAGELARRMASLGEWEDALFQNSPWSWAWN